MVAAFGYFGKTISTVMVLLVSFLADGHDDNNHSNLLRGLAIENDRLLVRRNIQVR